MGCQKSDKPLDTYWRNVADPFCRFLRNGVPEQPARIAQNSLDGDAQTNGGKSVKHIQQLTQPKPIMAMEVPVKEKPVKVKRAK